MMLLRGKDKKRDVEGEGKRGTGEGRWKEGWTGREAVMCLVLTYVTCFTKSK